MEFVEPLGNWEFQAAQQAKTNQQVKPSRLIQCGLVLEAARQCARLGAVAGFGLFWAVLARFVAHSRLLWATVGGSWAKPSRLSTSAQALEPH
jgi:hypothetical protein